MTENETNETSQPQKRKKRQKPPFDLSQKQWHIARNLMIELGETSPTAHYQAARIIAALGVDFAKQLLQEVLEIEANGGMTTADGTRRRTPGGVFFILARKKVTDEQRPQIFPYRKKKKKRKPAANLPEIPKVDEPTSEAEVPEVEVPAPEAEPDIPVSLPELPPEAEARFAKLQLAADQFRRKIKAIEAQPEDQQFLLALTRKMLKNTENQIDELLKPYRER